MNTETATATAANLLTNAPKAELLTAGQGLAETVHADTRNGEETPEEVLDVLHGAYTALCEQAPVEGSREYAVLCAVGEVYRPEGAPTAPGACAVYQALKV